MSESPIPYELLWQKLEKIDSKITDNSITLAELNSRVKATEKRLDATESKLCDIGTRLSEIDTRLYEIDTRIEKQSIKIDSLEDRLNTVEHKLDDKLSSKWFGIIMAAMSLFFVALQVGFAFISRSAT